MADKYFTQVSGRLVLVVGILLFLTGLLTGLLLGSQDGEKNSGLLASRNAGSEVGWVGGPDVESHSHDGAVIPPHSSEGHEKATALLVGVPCPCGRCQGPLETCSSELATEIVAIAAHLFTRGQSSEEVAQVLSANYGLSSVLSGHISGSMKLAPREAKVFQEVSSRNSNAASEIEEILLKGK